MLNKNDEIELEITDVNLLGSGVGKYDGIAVFVPFTAVGDKILCRIVKVCKSYCFGIIREIITASSDRADRDCEAYKKCGGCTFRHISYEAECKIKAQGVMQAFKSVGGFDNIPFEGMIAAENADRYRNKAQYPVARENGSVFCGFFSKRSHRVVPVKDCLLEPAVFSEITAFVTGWAEKEHISVYDEVNVSGLLRHIFIRQGYHTKEIQVCLVSRKADRCFNALAKRLAERFHDIRSVMLNINPKSTNVILGEKNITLYGDDHITDIMCGRKINLSVHSFYQVNTAQAERLYAKAAEYAELNGGENLLDLYCGAGTIGLSMADKVKSLRGVEIIPDAVENARQNAHVNGVDAEFICADAGEAARRFAKEGYHPDIIITDPPRKGCDEIVLKAICDMAPKKLVMISCNPQTAARDTARLCEMGFSVDKVCAVDLYPGTAHVETLIRLTKKA